MFKIGEFSKISNTTVRTLDHYAALGLLKPKEIDDQTNYRYYSADQLSQLNQIKLLQQTGLPLKTIKEIIDTNDLDFLEQHYNLQEEKLQEDLEELLTKQRMVSLLKQNMKEGKNMTQYNVVVKEIPERNVLSVRGVIADYTLEGELWQKLQQGVSETNAKLKQPPLNMTLFHDVEYVEKNADVEVQTSVVGEYPEAAASTFKKAPGFIMASVTFSGSFEQMPQVTQTIAEWLEANEYKIVGPMINIGHVSPGEDPNPENWVTESGFVVSK
ncbi:MerR family transcriptional regulator [Candidatus Enterococcus murrayae]|uniref:MerR family transcriptional regulator n=1 Tax=Candidatus Enterococcus murrayae TaxID=2815321 RepID=A0ABS3HPS0_9ENTE|nr:MerR family transcriptional regulator [Enterococcus sp. MJM16]MBO0454934.1 MerR family transcriptional regulator [Enterococcus sp. MJM16]